MDTLAINLGRYERGEVLGDEWVFGRRAVELINLGATERGLDRYRSSLFFNDREIYGQERAIEIERGRRMRHDEARELLGKRPHFFTESAA